MKQSRIMSFYEWSMKKKPLYWLLSILFWVLQRISNGVSAILSRLEEPFWRTLGKRFLQAVGIMVALIIVLVLVRIGYAYEWIGFGQTEVKGEIRSSKTLWDWLNLLIVPVVLAIGGYLFTRSDTKATQAAAERRAQDDALQAYLDHMATMQVPPYKDGPSLYKSRAGASLRTLARARTLTILSRLAGSRKRSVLEFLYESRLIDRKKTIVSLQQADLKGADLYGINLSQANLGGTDLSRANLGGADLKGADLEDADLSRANLRWASLEGANFVGANLMFANFYSAWGITTEEIMQQTGTWDGAIWPDGAKYFDEG